MTSQVVHRVSEYFPCKVVGDAAWERSEGLGTNFSASISETAVLPLLKSVRKKVSLGHSHRIRLAVAMSMYLRLFWRFFWTEHPFRKGNKAAFVVNLPTDLCRGKSELWLPCGQQREVGWGNHKQEKWVLGKHRKLCWGESPIFCVGKSWSGTSEWRCLSRTRSGNFAFGGGSSWGGVCSLSCLSSLTATGGPWHKRACGTAKAISLLCLAQTTTLGGYWMGLVMFGLGGGGGGAISPYKSGYPYAAVVLS